MARAPRRNPEAALAAVRALRGEADEALLRAGLTRGLSDPFGAVVAAAADLAAERELSALRPAIVAAWERLYEDAGQVDPGCVGKAACATALDRLDHPDRSPFLRGARWVQMQPVWGGSVDAAGPLRARCAMALARFGGTEALMALARALGDPLAPVRSAAAQALPSTGDPAAAALALLRVRAPDPEASVTADALGALLALRPDEGLSQAEELLQRGGELAELTTLALGQSRLPGALPLLEARLQLGWRAADREVVYVALGLLRSDEARDRLLQQVRRAPLSDARAAIRALASVAQTDALRAAVQAAADGRGLDDAIAEAFGG
jgi:HEAT repeat protein